MDATNGDPETYAIIGAAIEAHRKLKALHQITDIERAQVSNYLKATGLSRALLLNVGAGSLEHKRFLNKPSPSVKSV